MNFYSSSIITALTILQRKSEYPFFTPARVLGRRARRRGGTSGARAALLVLVPPNKPRYRRYRQINQAVPPVPPKTQSVPKKKPHPHDLEATNLKYCTRNRAVI